MSKKESALRIMEALSSVDQELLERCDISDAKEKKSAKRKVTKVSVFWRRTTAACLALIVVGTLSWNGLRLMNETSSGGNRNNETADLDQVTGYVAPQALDSNAEDLGSIENEEGTDGTENVSFVEQMVRGENQENNDNPDENPEVQDLESDMQKLSSETCVDYVDYSAKLTEQEARSEAVFGAYVPEDIPQGYTFEAAHSSTEGLNVTWTRGMDYIMIFLSITQEENLETVDVERTETYDERLYEIPYGDTVPAEYREVFDDPLFAAEDLSFEVVSSRMKSVADAGDTDTPRGNFSVLFPDGVVLRFNGRGTAEEIWNMLESVMR